VVAAAGRDRELHTFSVAVEGLPDETAYARAQAETTGTHHHALRAEVADPVKLLRELAVVYDEPLSDASTVPTYLLAQEVRQHVKVALTGDGADELLGGYLHWSRRFLADTGVSLPPELGGPGLPRRRRRALVDAYRGFRAYVGPGELAALGLPAAPEVPVIDRPTGGVADLLAHDLAGYLPGDVLVKTDRASMAHGLELRSPFLDRRVAELCLALPDRLKVSPTAEKLVLRDAMGGRLAPVVRTRDKLGFSGPMLPWLQGAEVGGLARDLLTDPASRLFDLVEPAGVTPFVGGDGQATWTLLVLALWAEEHRDARR
jgi:asparagine synthase (glutamine-hydrolysing)